MRRKNRLDTLVKCSEVSYPTLMDLSLAYDAQECPEMLLETYITNLNKSLNTQRMTQEQITEAGEIMYQEAPYLKITEVHEFFRRVKAFRYGEIYGSLDVMKLMNFFRMFLKERLEALNAIKSREMNKRRAEREEEAKKNAVPMPDSFKKTINSL